MAGDVPDTATPVNATDRRRSTARTSKLPRPSRHRSCQRLIEIGDDVVNVLDANRQADIAG